MPAHNPPTGTGSTNDIPEGLIAGHLLRLTRENLGLTQETAAEAVKVDVNTWRSWETGRRPLAHTKVGQLRSLLRRLQSLGADPLLVHHIEVAIETDLFIAHVLVEAGRGDPHDHMLAGWVTTRTWNDLVAWAVAGTPPKALARVLAVPGQRRGPAPSRPELSTPTRTRFFDALRVTAERTTNSPASLLLRRQAHFMAAWDDTPTGRDWLARAERAELRQIRRTDGWTPSWVAGRSLAVARACQGDPDQLRHFIAHHLVDDLCEAANLNYWAYWVGEGEGTAASDRFMAADLGAWRGTKLLRHLTSGLQPTTPYLELSIHSVWALLGRRPHLLNDDDGLTRQLHERVTGLLDSPNLSAQARRELDQIHFLTTARGPR